MPGDNYVAKKRNEVFYRINRDGLESILTIEKNQECVYNLANENYDGQSADTHPTKTLVTKQKEQNFALEVSQKTDFVLVDLRDEVAFEKYRIVEGSL